jgi:hypothetical protein
MPTESPERFKAREEMEAIEYHMVKIRQQITSLDAQHHGLVEQWEAARDRWIALGMAENP